MRPIAAPQYQLIADELRRAIIDGTLAPGTRLPTVRELAATHGVTTRTITEATRILAAEGLLAVHQRGKTTVRERPGIVRLVRPWYRDSAGKGSPWRADMAAQGRTGSWISQSGPMTATPAVAERLKLAAGARVMRTTYTFTADGEPTYLSTSWEPLAITGGTEIMLPEDGAHAGAGVIDRFAAIGIVIDDSDEEVMAHTLTLAEAERLRLQAGLAGLMIQRTYYAAGTPVETANIVLPPDYRPVYQIPVG